MQKVTPLYIAEATSTGGRDGKSKSSDGKLVVSLSTPKELGGAGGDGTNPEQMFAAGYSACFIGALKFVAGQEKKPCRPMHRSPPTWASARSRVVSAWTSTCTSTCRAWPRPMPKGWWKKRTRCARTPTLPAAMWMYACM